MPTSSGRASAPWTRAAYSAACDLLPRPPPVLRTVFFIYLSPLPGKWKTCTYHRSRQRPPTTTWTTRRGRNGTAVWPYCGRPRRTATKTESRRCCRRTRSAVTAGSRGKWVGWTRSAGRACRYCLPYQTPSSWSRWRRTSTSPRGTAGGISSGRPKTGRGN